MTINRSRPTPGVSSKLGKLIGNLFTLIVGSLYTYALCSSMLMATYIKPTATLLLVVSVGTVLFFHLWFYNRYTFFSFLILFTVFGAICFVNLYRADYQQEWFLALQDFIRQMLRHIGGKVPYQQEFHVIGLLMAFGIGLIAALNLRIRFGFITLSLLGAAAFAIPYLLGYPISQTGLILFFLCFLLMLVYKQGMGRFSIPRRPAFALTILPLCLVTIILAGLIPRPAVNYSSPDRLLQAIGDKMIGTEEYFYQLFDAQVPYFSFQTTGFSQTTGTLGGTVTANNRYVMRVTTDVPVYLKGAIKDTYTGNSWTKKNGETAVMDVNSRQVYYISDHKEMYRILGLINSHYQNQPDTFYQAIDYVPTEEDLENLTPLNDVLIRPFHQAVAMINDQNGHRRIEIQLGANRTRDIFVPAFAQILSLNTEFSINQDAYGNIYADEPLPKQTSYAFSFIDWNNPQAFDMAEYQDKISAFFEYTGIEWADYIAASDELSAYLYLPDTLPSRVGELAVEIAREETNPYRILKRLENYLHQYPYTLSPGDVPNGVDFVDYFLFEGQEGYCTYYASAFAVMARILGIPTRYVEGYALPSRQNEDGSYTVTNQEAHAWVEAWLPGIGWYPFEPTAPFSQRFYQSSVPTTTDIALSSNAETPDIPINPGNAPQETLDEMLPQEEETGAPPASENSNLEQDSAADALGNPGDSEERPRQPLSLRKVASIAFIGLISLIALRLGWYYRRRRRLERLDHKAAVLQYFRLLLCTAEGLGYPIGAGESAIRWFCRTESSLGIHHAKAAGETYSRAAYSALDITQHERIQFKLCYLELLNFAKKKGGRLSHYFNHYILQRY